MAVEVDDPRGGEEGLEAIRVAEVDDRSGEPSSFNGRIEAIVEDPGDHVVGSVRVVGLDRVEEMLEVRGEQLWERDREREVELGQLEQVVEQVAQLIVIETSELASCGKGLMSEVAARDSLSLGPRRCPQHRLTLRPEPHGQSSLRPGPGMRASSCRSSALRVALGSVRTMVARHRPRLGGGRARAHDACASRRSSRPLKIFRRPIWPLSAASSRWRWRVGRNSCVVWK